MASLAAPTNPSDRAAAPSERLDVVAVGPGGIRAERREVVRERLLRLRVGDRLLATLTATPGGETDLAMGFILTEGLLCSAAEVASIVFYPAEGVKGGEGTGEEADEVRVRLVPGAAVAESRRRQSIGSAGPSRFAGRGPRLRPEDVSDLRDRMVAGQAIFRATGGTHAAAIAEVPLDRPGGGLVVIAEDMARHMALDKAVGAAVGAGIDLGRSLLVLSSRLSFELVAKAAEAGIGRVAGVGAPSVAAVRLARRRGMFLAGFVRGKAMTVYGGMDILATPSGPSGDQT